MNEKNNKTWNRRYFLWSLGLTPLGCLPNNKKEESTPQPQEPQTPPEITDQPKEPLEVEDPDFNPTTPEVSCPPPGIIDLSKLQHVPEALVPSIKIYGPKHSAMVVIGLERYTHGKLRTVILTRDNGQTLVRREINSADVTPEDFIHPFIFESIALDLAEKKNNFLVMVVRLETTSGDQFFKFHFGEQAIEDVKYGKVPLKTLESLSFQSSQSPHHRHGTFYPKNSTIKNIDEKRFDEIINEANFSEILPNGIPYELIVARSDSTYQGSDNLNQLQITNLLGKPLSFAEPFSDIVRHPMFVVNKTIAGTVYRTLVRVN